MHLVLFALLSFSVYSQELTFNAGENWELKKNLLSADYALVLLETSNSLLIKKMPADFSNHEVESNLRKMIKNKEASPIPWSNIQIKATQDIEWFPGKKGKLMTVEHLKKNIPHTSIVGIQPLHKEHFFIFYSEDTLNFIKNEKEVRQALKSIKGH